MENRNIHPILFGSEAVARSEFPIALISQFLLMAGESKAAIALRVGQPPNVWIPTVPKPMSVKTKTCNQEQRIPFLSGFIPQDQAKFGRKNSKPLPDNCEFMPLRVELHKILIEAEKGNYSNFRINGNFLEFNAPLTDCETKQHIIFSIDLSDAQKTPLIPLTYKTRATFFDATGVEIEKSINMKNIVDARNITPYQIELKDPSKWTHLWNKDKFGNFFNALHFSFPVYYQLCSSDERQVMFVASVNKKPITGDVDILWIAGSMEDMKEKKITQQTYDCSKETELKALMKEYQDLLVSIYGDQAPKIEQSLNATEFDITRAGIISAFELLNIRMVNKAFGQSIGHFANPLQHGPETNNPGFPSPLDGTILHIYMSNTEPFFTVKAMTFDEKSLRDFAWYLTEKGYFISVHPLWDMQIWGPLVDKQKALNMPVKEQTLLKNDEYKKKHLDEEGGMKKLDTGEGLVNIKKVLAEVDNFSVTKSTEANSLQSGKSLNTLFGQITHMQQQWSKTPKSLFARAGNFFQSLKCFNATETTQVPLKVCTYDRGN